jgi:hypothetical protein
MKTCRWLAWVGALGVMTVLATVPGLWAQASEAQTSAEKITLPEGTKLYVRLLKPVSTKTSHLREAVTARVVREVPAPAGVVIPLTAQVQGKIQQLVPSSNPTDRARVLLRFTRLEIPDHPPVTLAAHLIEVENSRESVRPDGAIQGVLASELPLSHLEGAVAKISKSTGKIGEGVQSAQQKMLGKTDTSISFPEGTDLVLVLDKPLELAAAFPSAVAARLGAGSSGPIEQLLASSPQRVLSKDGKPGDPINLVVVAGSIDEIRQAFQEAGWSEAEKKSGSSIWQTVRAVAGDQGYDSAPVSQLYLYGRSEDLAFEKMLNTFAKRHHVRLWRSPAATTPGREIWLGAATHDTGMDIRPGVISHAIDPDLDDERTKIGADLVATGRVSATQLVARPDPLSEGKTATGGDWKTDGRLLTIELK